MLYATLRPKKAGVSAEHRILGPSGTCLWICYGLHSHLAFGVAAMESKRNICCWLYEAGCRPSKSAVWHSVALPLPACTSGKAELSREHS